MRGAPLERAGARLEGEWQGISHLTVDIAPPPAPGPFEVSVVAHLNRAATGLHARHVVVERDSGSPVEVEITFPEVGGVREPRVEITFRTAQDSSDHHVCLLDGGHLPLHPFFASARFTLTVDCPGGDCRPDAVPSRPEVDLPPVVDLLTKDYAGFVQVLSDWVRVNGARWADLSPASLERVLVELLAHQGDMLSYYQDRVAAEAFLETATQRHSLRQHGVLLGYEVFDGEAARTLLSIDPTYSGFVPRGLSVRMPGRPDEPPVVFHTVERVRVRPENGTQRLVPAAWPGATEARIPAGATELLLYGHGTRLSPGERLAFVQEGAPTQVVTLEAVTSMRAAGWVDDPTKPLSNHAAEVTAIRWRDPLTRPLRPWPTGTLTLHANLVEAAHGDFRRAWLGSEGWLEKQPVARTDVVLELTRRNHTAVRVRRENADVVHLRALLVPEGPVVFGRDPQGRLRPELELEIDGEVWTRVKHLHRSRSHDRHDLANADGDGRVWIELGDGVHGHEVEMDVVLGLPRHPMVLRYRVGDPAAGNCARGTLTEEVGIQSASVVAQNELAALGALKSITNVTPAEGGRAAESADAIRHNIPVQLMKAPLQRAVSLQDYAAVAAQVQGVDRAHALHLGGVFNTVAIVVDPEGRAGLTEELERRVWSHLDGARMAGREHIVLEPEYVALDVELVVCAEPGYVRANIRTEVLRALRPGPEPRQGWFHPDRLSFGEPLAIGDLLAFVQAIEGVHAVKATRFGRLRYEEREPRASIVPVGAQVLRLDADPTRPEHGKLQVRVVGLDEVDLSTFAIEAPRGDPEVC